MKRLTRLAFTLSAILFLTQSAHCLSGNISGYLGFRALDDNDWDQVDTQLQLAAIDRVDMDEWLAAVAETVADLRAAEDRVADQAERFKQESEN